MAGTGGQLFSMHVFEYAQLAAKTKAGCTAIRLIWCMAQSDITLRKCLPDGRFVSSFMRGVMLALI